MKFVVAIDSFKGCMSSNEANTAAGNVVLDVFPDAEIVSVPVSDGGEGWLDAFQEAAGGERVALSVYDPLMRTVQAEYLVNGDCGVIEVAKVVGLSLIANTERNPLKATSYGVGQLLADALRRGCRRLVVGLGGTATSDCGMGMLEALAQNLGFDKTERLLTLAEKTDIILATDVLNPLCGPMGAAEVFAPQKGADERCVKVLEKRAIRFADKSARLCGHDFRDNPGAGSAGGLGYAFMQYLNARCQSGGELLLQEGRFDDILAGSDLVITGEGSADAQTLMGKMPAVILRHAQKRNIPVWLLAGIVNNRTALIDAGFDKVEEITPPLMPLSVALEKTMAQRNLRKIIQELTLNMF